MVEPAERRAIARAGVQHPQAGSRDMDRPRELFGFAADRVEGRDQQLHGLTGARFDDRIIAPTRDDDNRVELTDALCRRITAANSSDLALWRHFQGLLEGAA